MYRSVYHLSAIRASRQLVIYSRFGKFNYTLSWCAIIGEEGRLPGHRPMKLALSSTSCGSACMHCVFISMSFFNYDKHYGIYFSFIVSALDFCYKWLD